MVIQPNGLIQHGTIAAEAPLPIAIAEHGYRVRFRRNIVGLLEHPAQRRPYAEQIKIISGNQLTDSALGLAMPIRGDLVMQRRYHSGEHGITIAKIAVHGIREIQTAGAISRTQRALIPARKVEQRQLLGRLDGKGPQQDLIE